MNLHFRTITCEKKQCSLNQCNHLSKASSNQPESNDGSSFKRLKLPQDNFRLANLQIQKQICKETLLMTKI